MTRDLDVTYKSTIYDVDQLKKIIQCIIQTPTDSFFTYHFIKIVISQEDDQYSGYSVFLEAIRDKSRIPFKIDISNNTLIYPEAVKQSLHSLFDDKLISINTYSIENIIAEKFETTLDRGEFNTRIRDLFDIYFLIGDNSMLIDKDMLSKSIYEVCNNRGTLDNIKEFDSIINTLKTSRFF